MGQPERASDDTTRAEGRLLAVLLVDALQILGRPHRAPVKRQVQGWICDGTSGTRFSFDRACEVVGLPARPLRRRLGLRVQVPRRSTATGFVRGPRASRARRRTSLER